MKQSNKKKGIQIKNKIKYIIKNAKRNKINT